MLGGKPLVTYALKTLNSSTHIDAILIAAEKKCVGRFKRLVKKFKLSKVIDVVCGGATRAESVRNCLKAAGTGFDIVLVHDGARPFVDRAAIAGSIRLAAMYGGCIVAVAEHDTVKLSDTKLFISKTLDRKRVFRAQTPQVFRRELIEKAYAVKHIGRATDDAGLVERSGGRVKIFEGSSRNIKVTTREDLKLAEVLL